MALYITDEQMKEMAKEKYNQFGNRQIFEIGLTNGKIIQLGDNNMHYSEFLIARNLREEINLYDVEGSYIVIKSKDINYFSLKLIKEQNEN